jgi:lipopolysaccharide/colanic/teichoic acid biosynthesis glycosyltransferase
MKRFFDVVFVLVLSPVILFLVVLIGLLILIFLGKPVLFTQVRPGLNGLPFTLMKFRSMADLRDHQDKLLPNEQRVTRFGSLLRSTSLDELPELLNVLRGEMSIVGPRPLVMRYLPRYSTTQMRRHSVLPGITGWAQVNGRNNISWKTRLALDVWYVDNVSLLLDMKIVMLTVGQIFRRADISEKGEFSSSEFMGDGAD